MDRAVRHYQKWITTKYHPARIYWIFVTLPLACAAIWWVVAVQTGKPYEWLGVIKLSVLFLACGAFVVVGLRHTAVAASWVIANEAKGMLQFRASNRAWQILAAKYRGVHPIVINHPDFQRLLAEALASARAAGDPEADQLLRNELAALAPDGTVPKFSGEGVDQHSRKAARFIALIFLIMAIVSVLRFVVMLFR